MSRRNKVLISLLLLVTAIVIIQINNCSLIGFGIGSAIDKSKPDSVYVPGWGMEIVKPGKKIKVILNDGQEVGGEYRGLYRASQEEYAERYTDFRKQKWDKLALPALGDSITILSKTGLEGKYNFEGLDYQYLPRKFEKETDSRLVVPGYIIFIKQIGDTTSKIVFLRVVDKIVDSSGNIVYGRTLERLASTGEIPFMSEIAIEDSTGRTLIPTDRIYQIQVPNKKHAKWVGLGIGAAVDVSLIIIGIAMGSQDWGLGGTTWSYSGSSSCPFVYSFDGEKYFLDSEPYGNAIYKAAQRTDWDNLDHLTEVQGTYHLKITNELQETQYIDELKLLVIDYPRKIRVVPSSSGGLHFLSAPQIPSKAEDFRGFDVLELVKSKDDQFWISNPFGRDLENRSGTRDGLIFEFDRPAGCNLVKLAFNLQNTPWASFLQGQILELHGSKLDEWYDLLNTSPEASKAFQEVLIREGMLLIKLWNGKVWQDFDFIWGVGSALPKDQVVLLDLGRISGEVLRVKVESTVGLWMINSVHADYTPDLPLRITELSPAEAKDHTGRDLKELFYEIDGIHYSMPTQKDWAELVFKAPPRKKGLERSFILKITGYYTIHVDAKGEPQRDLIVKLMSEPGAYGQYTLQLLNRYVMSALEQLE